MGFLTGKRHSLLALLQTAQLLGELLNQWQQMAANLPLPIKLKN